MSAIVYIGCGEGESQGDGEDGRGRISEWVSVGKCGLSVRVSVCRALG